MQDERPLGAAELASARLRDTREGIGSEEASPQHRPDESARPTSGLLVDLAHADDVGCAGAVGDRLPAEDERCVAVDDPRPMGTSKRPEDSHVAAVAGDGVHKASPPEVVPPQHRQRLDVDGNAGLPERRGELALLRKHHERRESSAIEPFDENAQLPVRPVPAGGSMDEHDRRRHPRDSFQLAMIRAMSNRSQAFSDRGYLPPVHLFDERECEAILAGLTGDQPPPKDWDKGWAATSPEFFRLAVHDDILDLVTDLLGDDVLLWGASLLVRRPGEAPYMAHGHRVLLA